MLNPAQIKRERYEEQFQMQDQPPPQDYYQAPPPQMVPDQMQLQQRFPPNLFQATAQLVQHVGRDMAVFENTENSWRCLVFLETVLPVNNMRVMDLKVTYPVQSIAMMNANLIAVDRPIQYIATLVWKPGTVVPNPAMSIPINDGHMVKYYDVLSTVGKVLETVSKLAINQDSSRQGFLVSDCLELAEIMFIKLLKR